MPVRRTDQGAPGFYQDDRAHGQVGGPRLAGRKSGRTAPRDHHAQPAHEAVLQKHDLLPMSSRQVGPNSSFDANQGQLFDTEKVAPTDKRSDREIAKSMGVASGEIEVTGKSKQSIETAGQPGFMPGLTPEQKVRAIQGAARSRQETGAAGPGHTSVGPRGGKRPTTNTPLREMMQERATAGEGAPNQPWYMGVDSEGQHDRTIPGDAALAVGDMAARQGVDYTTAARAVAITSPQMQWKSEGASGDPEHPDSRNKMEPTSGRLPNVEAAEAVVENVRETLRYTPDSTPEEISEAAMTRSYARSIPDGQTQQFRTSALPEAADKAGKWVAERSRNPNAPTPGFPVAQPNTHKSPNFDASLHASHPSRAIQRVASSAWTPDSHDANSVGINPESRGLGQRGVAEVVQMTGRRSALKAGNLSANEQARQWEAQRSKSGLGRGNEMLTTGTTDIRPDLSQSRTKTRDDRSDEAKRLGTAF